MEMILSPFSASISELKKNPTALLRQADGSPVAILNHNRPTAYLVPADVYENMLEMLEEYELGLIVCKRLAEEAEKAVEVDLDAL
jgi:antitoxin StbD